MPEYIAAYALHVTASDILLLAKADGSQQMPKERWWRTGDRRKGDNYSRETNEKGRRTAAVPSRQVATAFGEIRADRRFEGCDRLTPSICETKSLRRLPQDVIRRIDAMRKGLNFGQDEF